MLYTFNLHGAVCQLYLPKTKKFKIKKLNNKTGMLPWAMVCAGIEVDIKG